MRGEENEKYRQIQQREQHLEQSDPETPQLSITGFLSASPGWQTSATTSPLGRELVHSQYMTTA